MLEGVPEGTINGWSGSIGITPDLAMLRGINPTGGTWGIGDDGRAMIGQSPFGSNHLSPDGRVKFYRTIHLPQ